MSVFVDLWRDPFLTRNEYAKPIAKLIRMLPRLKMFRFTFNEQDGLAHLLITHPHVLQHVGIVERRRFNSYPEDYQEGDLVVHFAGCRVSDKDCDKMFVDFWNKRTVVKLDFLRTV